MTAYDIINKKKNGEELSNEEINFIVKEYVSDKIPDYQMSALLMAICFNSLTDRETTTLTMAMAHSGDMFELGLDKFCVDKHSTGGVGDKTTLIAAPIVASCGVYVPKMSGRGLGHTGGTIDKLESIPNFNTSLDYETFIEIIKDVGFAIAGQTGSLVPADKKIYALRNSTATVDSLPLICSSIMSKKLATGADGIVLDVKVGDGAFMKNENDAINLAKAMVNVGRLADKKCTAIISNMDKPLGRAVGNSLEVIEAIEALKGNSPNDLWEVSLALSAHMLNLADVGEIDDCFKMAEDAVKSGRALECFKKFVSLQNGDANIVDDYSLFPKATNSFDVISDCDGYIHEISCEKTGLISLSLGAGRQTKESNIDLSAGILFNKTVGDKISKGECLATLYTSSDCDIISIANDFKQVFCINDDALVKTRKNIIKIIKSY